MVPSSLRILTAKKCARTIVLVCTVSIGATPALAEDYFWVDWLERVTTATGVRILGQIDSAGTPVSVVYENPLGISFLQTNGGTDYWTTNSPAGRVRDASVSPYTSDQVSNIPTGSDIIALNRKGTNRLSFYDANGDPLRLANPVFSYVSLNGNGYGFDQDFTILSFGDPSDGNSCGFWGCGTSFKREVDGQYQLLGTGEPHGTLMFNGAFDTLTWESLSAENWNGFTFGIQGTAEQVFVPKPEPVLEPEPEPAPPTVLERVLAQIGASTDIAPVNGMYVNIAENIGWADGAGVDGSITNMTTGMTTAAVEAVAGAVIATEFTLPTIDLGNLSTTALGAVSTGTITLGVNSAVDEAASTTTRAISAAMIQIGGSADTGALLLNVANNTSAVNGSIQNTMIAVNGSIGSVNTTALGAVSTGNIVSGVDAAVQGIVGMSGQNTSGL